MYKALRNGVQEVAVKVLLCTDEDQLNAFQKVALHFFVFCKAGVRKPFANKPSLCSSLLGSHVQHPAHVAAARSCA